ncbi:MAG TPA: NUDIX domain-containing protein [Acidimicrobiia bacterium]|nr:NUDIX domain-containing protein [Acidimicrobiia bacterium]
MTGRHGMWDGEVDAIVDVPVSGGENVMLPVIRAVVRKEGDPTRVIVQRRDNASEVVRGLFEIPGGRWRAGEPPVDAISREVLEETGLTVVRVHGVTEDAIDDRRTIASIRPLVVVAGVHGAFPAVHIVVVVDAFGEPRSTPGESSDVRWWSTEEVRSGIGGPTELFIPSSRAALNAFLRWHDDGGSIPAD